MKNENEFNAALSKSLRRLQPSVFIIKASDKFTIGISDFLIFGFGKTLALECKYVREWPSDKALLLRHPFTGEQQTFLESMQLSGHAAFGLVAVGETKEMFLIPGSRIPRDGNWDTGSFKTESHALISWLDPMELTRKTLGG